MARLDCVLYDKYSIFMRTRRDLLQFANILVEMMYNARKLVETYDVISRLDHNARISTRFWGGGG